MTVNVNGYGDTAEYLGPAEVPGEATPTRSVVLVYHPVAIAECCCAGLEASTASHLKVARADLHDPIRSGWKEEGNP